MKDNILLRIEKIKADVENMEQKNTIRCVDCNIDIHRASYSRHLKTKKHLEKNNVKPKKVIDKDKKKKQIEIKIIKLNTNSLIIF